MKPLEWHQRRWDRDAQMAGGATDWSFAAVAWIYEHDAAVLDDAGAPV